jgi:hypothetical protein
MKTDEIESTDTVSIPRKAADDTRHVNVVKTQLLPRQVTQDLKRRCLT